MSRSALACLVLAALVAACTDRVTDPGDASRLRPDAAARSGTPSSEAMLVRQLAASRGIVPLVRPAPVRAPLVRLGQALIFDPILSGNRNIACATCHLPGFGTGDGRSLSIGQGGVGEGPDRATMHGAVIPRNAPPLFNMSAMRHLFWDGRVQLEPNGEVRTPAGVHVTPPMRRAFEFGPISALAMFPVTNRAEMRADSGNELAEVRDEKIDGIWKGLMRRLGDIPEYRAMFEAAYPGTPFPSMTFAHASNAIAGFVVDRYTFASTPWDRFLAGDDGAMTARQVEGAKTFLTLKCSICHNGAAFSDEQFHNVAVAQIGPGEGNGASGHDDFGRMNVTDDPADRYRFRTTPLRNVELTGPYGHDGAIMSLRAFIEHYSESDRKLHSYDVMQLEPSLRATLQPTATQILAQRDTLLNGVVLTNELVDKLMDYMSALTDDAARDLRSSIPARVPSGLPIRR